MRKKRRIGAENAFHSLDELHAGDYVVHTIHGIGIFAGIENLKVSGMSKDYIKIKYAKQDVLYVPVTQLDLVSKYIGPKEDTKTVKLNRLGGKEWEKSRSKVRAAVADMAKELTELYAKRLNTPGFEFSPDIDMQSDFERRFEYVETDDQLRCIHEIKRDMEKPYPMDRLLCGDVGFGKTEVALRAVFKCIADGKQCAILVPTTILALQHYQTILKRFEGFPIEAGMLSRFCTKKEIEKKQNKNTHPLKQLLIIFSDCSIENPISPNTLFDFPKNIRNPAAAIDNKTTKTGYRHASKICTKFSCFLLHLKYKNSQVSPKCPVFSAKPTNEIYKSSNSISLQVFNAPEKLKP